ncbi:MAG: hypothetical protein A3J28_01710 [Acidobacteria bacterium RIFCSPLOWO2_12_FULL_60_22]|nr:MAG: hypothetical protein A3J28_01710 [Acidobacteria bacterium RIFCSPLOWO2_12_FULL_60_22]
MGTISGTVRDASGAVIPRSAVTLRNLETGITRSVTTDDQGRYNAPTLPLGNYQVRAEISGFETGVRTGIQLTVGQQAVVDFALKVGEVTQSVEVTGEAPLVETTSGAVSGLVGEQQMRDLPLNGRSFDQLIALQAGTTVFTSQVGGSVTQGDGQKFSVAGARWRSNRFYQDGTELSGAAYLADQPGSAAGLNLGVEAIREFRVLTSSYSPEYGKRTGAAVVTVTRSGTNSFHGSAFEFLRNSALDARNFFDSGTIPAFKRNNVGGSLGGPLRKDKTFFFLTYEGLRQSLGLSNVAIVPDQNAHNGFLPGPGGTLTNVGVDPRVAPYLALYPLPNGPVLGDGTGIYFNNPVQITQEDYGLVRMDHSFSDSDSAFIAYNIDRADQPRPLLVPVFADDNTTGSHVATLAETHIFSPTLLNDLRFGFGNSIQSSQYSYLVVGWRQFETQSRAGERKRGDCRRRRAVDR